MLFDDEQRVLDELESHYGAEAGEPTPSGPASGCGQHAARAVRRATGSCSSSEASAFGLLLVGVAVAALALITATALGWLFWRLASHCADGGRVTAPPVITPGIPKARTEPARATRSTTTRWRCGRT